MGKATEKTEQHAKAEHVRATNALSGAQVSPFVATKVEEYAYGKITAEELVKAIKERYGL